MFAMILGTVLLMAIGWYFFQKRPSNTHKFDDSYLSKSQQKKLAKESKNEKSTVDPEEQKDGKSSKKNQQVAAKKPKNKVDHQFFFKSFKKNESNILDFDISRDNQYIAIASKDRYHVLYDIKKDSVVKFMTSSQLFNLDTIPHSIAVSEHGSIVAIALENKVTIFKKKGDALVQLSCFEATKDKILGLYVSEEPEFLVVAGSLMHCSYHVYDLQGHQQKYVKSDISGGYKVHFEKFRRRCVYYSDNPDIRIFGSQFSVKGEWKDFAKEHSAFGHKNGVLCGCFSWKSNTFFSLSKDKTLKQWDVSNTGFDDSHVRCIQSWEVDPALIGDKLSIEWVGTHGEGEKKVNYLCLAHGISLSFLKCSSAGLIKIDEINDAHHGEIIDKMTYIASDKDENKGVLFTQSDKKLFSWKPKFE